MQNLNPESASVSANIGNLTSDTPLIYISIYINIYIYIYADTP